MQKTTHIINKVFLEVNTNSSKKAFALKDNLGVFLKRELFPIVESYFDKQNTVLSGSTLRFNKIDIEINQVDISNLNNLKNSIVYQLKKRIDSEIKNVTNYSENQNELVVLSKNKSKQDAFIYFLKTGKKPWWQSNIYKLFDEKGIKAIISETGFSSKFKEALTHKKIRQRLVNQFNNNILTLLITSADSEKIRDKHKIFSILENNNTLKNTFWMAIIDTYRLNNSSKIKTMLRQLKANKTIDLNTYQTLENFANLIVKIPLGKKKEIEIPKEKDILLNNKSTEKKEELDKNLYLNNAGLVLMHPFLKPFFINAKLADSNGKIIESEIETSIHLLHYLCTKEEQKLESELVLEKFLCGYPINKPMQRFIALPQELKHMAEEVLQSAITHWEALKNTSPDGLRTGFLQREGKLMIEKDSCKIVVERKAQDILLDKIPWNIHLIKLPWLDNLIFVEW